MVYYDDLQNVKPKKTIIFSVEGNIGSGKSTLLKLLEAASYLTVTPPTVFPVSGSLIWLIRSSSAVARVEPT